MMPLPKPVSVPVPPDTPLQCKGSQRVTVCDADVRFLKITLVPEATVFAFGLKQNDATGVHAVPDTILTAVCGRTSGARVEAPAVAIPTTAAPAATRRRARVRDRWR